MTIEQAIEKAIEGGFNDDAIFTEPLVLHRRFGVETAAKMTRAYIFSLPLFWQSLGKAMGWSESPQAHRGLYHKDAYGYHQWTEPQYIAEMHRFIDHLAEGKDAESFFETL